MTARTGTLDSFLNIAGTNNKVSIGNSITGSSGAVVRSLVNWSSAGTNNSLTVTGWHNQFESNNASLPVLQAGQSVQYYSFPVVNAFGDPIGTNTNGFQAAARIRNSVLPYVGLQHFRAKSGCTTAPTVGATCTTAPMFWHAAMPDTNYTMGCMISNPIGVPTISSVTPGTASFTVTIAALTTAAAGGDINCWALHD